MGTELGTDSRKRGRKSTPTTADEPLPNDPLNEPPNDPMPPDPAIDAAELLARLERLPEPLRTAIKLLLEDV